MPVTVDWPTKIINVSQDFLTPLGGSRYELDTNLFRLALRDAEDNEDGIVYLPTHNHNTKVLLGGIEYARVLEIINGYTITFEEKAQPYSVNLVGSNNNILDVTNLGTVQILSNNSAGLVQMREIEHSSFNGGITVDATSPYTGTTYPTGTVRRPVNNLSDAYQIAVSRGFSTFYIIGDITISTTEDFTGMIFIGESKSKSTITIAPAANVYRAEFYEAKITGTLDGDALVKGCVLENLNYISGFVEECVLASGTIVLGGGAAAHFLHCYSGVPGATTPTIDMGGSGQSLALRNYNGGIRLINKSGTDAVSLDINSGQVILENTVTAGTIIVRGIAKLTNNSTATVDATNLVQGDEHLIGQFWTTSEAVDLATKMAIVTAILKNKTITDPITGIMTVYADDNSTPLLTAQLYEDATALQAYRGSGAERREKLQ